METIGDQNKYNQRTDRYNAVVSILPYIKYFLLPFLVGIFPTILYYANNIQKLNLAYFWRAGLTYFFIAAAVYLLFLMVYRKKPLTAANSAFVFLVFFNLYALLESILIKWDRFPVRFFTTIPIVLILIGYSVWILNKLNATAADKIWSMASLMVTGLIIFNLVTIIPFELNRKANTNQALSGPSQTDLSKSPANEKKPDIYYILFDEFSGFEPMREYWHNPEIDGFINFLESKNFQIIEDSHGSSTNSIHQMASRLNYQNFPYNFESEFSFSKESEQWYDAISDNQVLKFLKQEGYTTISFIPFQFANLSSKTIKSDISYSVKDIPATTLSLYFDEFWILVADKTMLKELSSIYKKLGTDSHSNFIFFTINRVSNLRDVPSPKFIYAHLLFPHSPYLFDKNGNLNLPSAYNDNAYYLGNYNYSMKMAQEIVNHILEGANPENPPVIILQSDHGFRNFSEENGFKNQLPDFPVEFKTSILYARLIPGYTPAHSAQESDPINTFPILFNFLFDAGIPLQ